jgi:hypothetical protein
LISVHSGNSTDYCGDGCVSDYGLCDSTESQLSVVPSTSSSLTSYAPTASSSSFGISEHGECGPSYNQTCLGSIFGNCCSQFGFWYALPREISSVIRSRYVVETVQNSAILVVCPTMASATVSQIQGPLHHPRLNCSSRLHRHR